MRLIVTRGAVATSGAQIGAAPRERP